MGENGNGEGTPLEMPRYKCHKLVDALKISKMVTHRGGRFYLLFEDSDYEPFEIYDSELTRFKKVSGDDPGYLVVYEDGYRSWSPTKAFEDGYTRL